MSTFNKQKLYTSLAIEIGEDLAMWPIGPFRILQINGNEVGTIVADKIPYANFTILSHGHVHLTSQQHRFEPINVRTGHWSNTDWGEGYDVVLCFRFLLQLTDRDRISFLTKAQRSLARGGRTIAIEVVTLRDTAARELQYAGMAAGCERVHFSSMATDESWSAIVFERDRWSTETAAAPFAAG